MRTDKQRTGLSQAERDAQARESERKFNEQINAAILKAGCPIQTRWSRTKGWH